MLPEAMSQSAFGVCGCSGRVEVEHGAQAGHFSFAYSVRLGGMFLFSLGRSVAFWYQHCQQCSLRWCHGGQNDGMQKGILDLIAYAFVMMQSAEYDRSDVLRLFSFR